MQAVPCGHLHREIEKSNVSYQYYCYYISEEFTSQNFLPFVITTVCPEKTRPRVSNDYTFLKYLFVSIFILFDRIFSH